MGSILCEQCPAACCRYLALPIDKPKTVRDFDDLRWYVMHEGIAIFVEDGDWYIQIQTTCKHLGKDNLCTIYETRPRICREYEPGECDYCGADYGYDHLFTHASQIETFYEQKTGRKLPLDDGAAKGPYTRRRTGAKSRQGLVPLGTS